LVADRGLIQPIGAGVLARGDIREAVAVVELKPGAVQKGKRASWHGPEDFCTARLLGTGQRSLRECYPGQA